jgi:hypothetical protein
VDEERKGPGNRERTGGEETREDFRLGFTRPARRRHRDSGRLVEGEDGSVVVEEPRGPASVCVADEGLDG